MNAYLAEFIGTALLILMGNGVVANVCLNKTKAQNAGWIVITTAWAFAVYVAVIVAGPYSGAHLNPAVTLGLVVIGAFDNTMALGYIAAQLLGGMFGALLVYIFYRDHFAATEDQGTKRACFCTEPAIRRYSSNFINELIGTFVLLFVIFYITGASVELSEGSSVPIGLGSLGALPVAILVWAIGLSLGGTTGYAINPARDLAPRITLALLGNTLKTSADWQYSWIPVLGPITGALLAGIAYNLLM
ncbi:MIP/aquaporin family protein [Avibacterium paragallinarum]|uniref:Aquaporin n=1 Tax=Avibacterium paragallinarum TaxID=728 RepID=A0AAE5TJZ7_AVIPA|nr:MIP/aquaporin family protein [Avibacterium paragallinarum]MEE3608787.1 MIP/aquaporin family protein [Avibacterium paragallinarum]MEE3620162.1 MIP/aquaporin family protein [Avibacterium paragallinarum]MEE3668155.1 MIP/aquaporin family protein [Avibacterium paragallinarum]MEE3680991.1 MIP/aquaporin family protein [Avibacterium paragallinarum]MEE4385828.1 MIP/aquaporin family protein [Avibacterium paragallinarum]